MRKLIVAIVVSGMLGCASMRPERPAFTHVVIVWLKHPGDASERQQLIDRSKRFTAIPGVERIALGTVLPSTRMGVDSSFDFALVMTFKDEASLRAYDRHPIHQQAVKDLLAPLAAKFVIYDFENR